MIRNTVKLVLMLGLGLTSSRPLGAADGLFYKEINLMGGWSKDDGWLGGTGFLKNSVGFEWFRRFSNDYGDFLTLDLQVRLAYDADKPREDAWGLEIHNAWLEYKLGLGRSLRIGHFAPAFGLESILDTHGTLMQTAAMQNVGFKQDWGVGHSGYAGPLDYAIALQMGTGMPIRSFQDNVLFTGRIGAPGTKDFQYGLSLLYGRVIESGWMATIPAPPLRRIVMKKRIAVDSRIRWRTMVFKGEASYGLNDSEDVVSLFLETDISPSWWQEMEFQAQAKYWKDDSMGDGMAMGQVGLGCTYTLHSWMSIRAAMFHHWVSEERDIRAFVQFHFYWT